MTPKRPDPSLEIRVGALHTLAGANYWSRGPVTRIDLAIGAYDEISSADVPGLPESLLSALPGLIEHRCSMGRRGGFLERLRRGTYAAHIVEHVALELQVAIGHEVGYGRARGRSDAGEYIVVFEHVHSSVGRNAGLSAVAIVQAAFASLPVDVAPVMTSLARTAASPDPRPRPAEHVACGILGGADRDALRRVLTRHPAMTPERVVTLSTRSLLDRGLPYASSDVAVLFGLEAADLPERFAGGADFDGLHSVAAEAVRPGGFLIMPATGGATGIVSERDVAVATFATASDVEHEWIHARPSGERLVVMEGGEPVREAAIGAGESLEVQLVALLVAHILEGRRR